jgi:hypothetical protein
MYNISLVLNGIKTTVRGAGIILPIHSFAIFVEKMTLFFPSIQDVEMSALACDCQLAVRRKECPKMWRAVDR